MSAEPFQGVIGRFVQESRAWWPEPVAAPAGTPNVVLVVLDDVGFAQLGCFGSDLATPALDRLAANGLRYTNFHTTALCSPTRAALLTGRNHHSVGMGRVIELATGFPGYHARIPKSAGFLSELLLEHGFATWAVGKWHLAPVEDTQLAAPRHRWPLGRGFERFYGFFGGETHQFAPALVCDNHQISPPRRWEDGYHLTEDLVDRSIELVSDLRAIDPAKPFFLYLCPGACHSPHQAPREWIEGYRGRFDAGWDAWRAATLARQLAAGILPAGTELSPRPDWVPAWASLTDDERRLYARYMEAFAGFLSHTDHHLGRFVDFLADRGELDNTLLVVLSDNGASSEGGPNGSVNDVRSWNLGPQYVADGLAHLEDIGGPRCHNNYPWGWTVAGNTPFRRWKREVHEGGVADPLLVHWPAGIAARGELRRQYVHAIDILPTVLDVLGAAAPQVLHGVPQRPLEGVSFADTLSRADAPDRHLTQYYEMFGCRALYHEGWKAVTYHQMMTADFDADQWELYDVRADPSECHDLAASHPDKVRELVERWWVEAARYQVLPLDARPLSELVLGRPRGVPARARYVYYPGTAAVPEHVAVNVHNRSHTVTAEVDLPDGPVQGVLISQGSLLGGWSLYVRDNLLHYVHNYVSYEQHRAVSAGPVPAGAHRLGFRFTRTAEHQGVGELLVDDAVVGQVEIGRFTPLRFSVTGAGLTCGYSEPLPVTEDYQAPFRFTGTLHRVTVDVAGAPFADPAGEAAVAIATQ